MATVTITLCDSDDANLVGVAVKFDTGECDETSPAHLLAMEVVADLQQASADAMEELADQELRASLFAPHKKGQCDD